MKRLCDVQKCNGQGQEEDLGCLCPRHSEACEEARDGESWTKAFIDAGPNADAADVAAEWYSRWLARQA